MRLTSMLMSAILLVATPTLAADPAPQQPAVSSVSLQLAHRLLDDQGDPFRPEVILAGFDRAAAKSPGMKNAAARRAALQEAIASSEQDFHDLRDRLAEIYAENLSDQEMSGWIAFLETPVGRSIQQKKMATGSMGSLDLTPEETSALKQFNDSPVAKSIEQKNGALLGEAIQAQTPVMSRVQTRAQAIYCQKTGDCTSPPGQP